MPQTILNPVADRKNLFLYQKSELLVLLTDVFCRRFLPLYGDRTVDQMNQAARSGKQNLVEGSKAAKTSSEDEVRLINVARASCQELREDYEDYLNKHSLSLWGKYHPRFNKMLTFCRSHNQFSSYSQLAEIISDEEFCNLAITLCHIVDRMYAGYLSRLEKRLTIQGGLRERMFITRTGYTQEQDRRLQQLEAENLQLKAQLVTLQQKLQNLEASRNL